MSTAPEQIAQDEFADTPPEQLDESLAELAAKQQEWARLPIADRRAILTELTRDYSQVAERWAATCQQAEGIPGGSNVGAEEWIAGPYLVLRNLQLLDRALADIERHGRPRIPGPIGQRSDGRVTARVFPQTLYDRIFYGGITAEVWMQPGVTVDTLAQTQASAYRQPGDGGVSLVLGAGNVSSIGPMDLLYKLFVENQVVLCKMHPVNAYLGPMIEQAFQALIDWGVLRIAYGGVEVGAYLCQHPSVDEIHITGSDKTVEAIVFGPGEEGQKRKAERRPKNTKAISSELGNVSPVIVVPGPWSAGDLEYQGLNLTSMLTNNAGFNCNAARMVIQHREWQQRDALTASLRQALASTPTRNAYYPGAADRYNAFMTAHPEAEQLGQAPEDHLPWALIPEVDPEAEDEICCSTEAFCGVIATTSLAAASTADFIDQAVDFANDRMWGTLNATLIVHPKSLKDPAVAAAYERALDNLEYGTIAINSWAAVGYGLVVTPWGAYPGHDVYDIQSGTGVVHNTLMFDRVQKAVIRTPFRILPKPVWFPNHRTALEMGQRITEFEAAPSPLKLPGILWRAVRG